jgi:hypothetical protein
MAYDASFNNTFFGRLTNWSVGNQDQRDEGARLQDIWNSLSVISDPDFTDVDGVTTAEATSLITMLQDFDDFNENRAVSTGDRVAVTAPFLDDEP